MIGQYAPMHVSVIGHSDSIGLKLAPGKNRGRCCSAKCCRIEFGETVPVDSWRFAAYGPQAVPWAIGKVTAAEPDVVIIMVSSYWCAFGRVSNKVRQQYGERAERWYLRAEDGFVKHAEREHGTGKPTNTRTRRFMRRAVGVAAYAGLEEVTDVFATIVRKLAQLEHLQVVLVSDHHFTTAVREANAGIEPALAHFAAVIRPIANEHRFLLARYRRGAEDRWAPRRDDPGRRRPHDRRGARARCSYARAGRQGHWAGGRAAGSALNRRVLAGRPAPTY